ncbi:MAG: fimbria major subunit [Muribaculaceae bacterium]|nr:fimbria major subunit [Muribaculaceae bacterium]
MKKSLLYGMMATGLLFTGCNSDDPEVLPGNEVSEVDQTFYVSMRLAGDVPGSRAEGDDTTPSSVPVYADGTGDESKVNNAYFVFYDDRGYVIGDIVKIDLDDTKWVTNTETGTVEKSYKSVVAVPVRKGEKKPNRVICYINPIEPGTLNVNLSTIQTVSRPFVYKTLSDNSLSFAMSNSVYYPEGEAEDSEPQVAVAIPSTQLYDTEKAAEDAADADNCITIHVERYATKLGFTVKEGANQTYKTATRVYNTDGSTAVKTVNLNFVPQYWALNAEANESYVIKSFREESADGVLLGDNYKYGVLNARINPADPADFNGGVLTTGDWNWNNPTDFRSFWGMSPAYFTSQYPEVSSDVMGDNALQVNQKYISYNELSTLGFSVMGTTPDYGPHYFKETTVGSIALSADNPNPAAAVASVIYVGKYNVEVDGTTFENTDFYTYLTGNVDGVEEDRPYVYFKNAENSAASAVPGGESMLKRFLVQCGILFKGTADAENKISYREFDVNNTEDMNILASNLMVSEISDAVKQNYDGNTGTMLKLQNNARTLQFKAIPSANTGIYILTGNGYKQIVSTVTDTKTQVTLTQANIALLRNVGMSYFYNKSHAYFNIPVKHLGWYRRANDQMNSAELDWSKVRVGDFGMVRNHSYSVNVTNIIGLASGIGGDDVPIVPPATPKNCFVAYNVKILRWAVVPTQDVVL